MLVVGKYQYDLVEIEKYGERSQLNNQFVSDKNKLNAEIEIGKQNMRQKVYVIKTLYKMSVNLKKNYI